MAFADPITALLNAWDFVRWTDDRLLVGARSIPEPAEYARDRGISHGSVHTLLLHLMSSQSNWLREWLPAPANLPDTSAAACPDLPAIERTWPAVHEALERFLKELEADDLHRPIRFMRRGREIVLPLGETIAHLLDHAGYHRGQLNTLVTLAGGQRVWLSYWVYAMRLHPQASAVTDGDFVHA